MGPPINSIIQFHQETSPDSRPCDVSKGIFSNCSECGGGELGRKAAEIGNLADIAGMWRGRDEVA